MKVPLKIKVHKADTTSEVVRISSNALTKIQQLQKESGLSASKILSEIVMHYADEVEFIEVSVKWQESKSENSKFLKTFAYRSTRARLNSY